jgi:hypothetical protein
MCIIVFGGVPISSRNQLQNANCRMKNANFFLSSIYAAETAELGTRFFLDFALALSRSIFGRKFRAFAFALSHSRAL